MSRKNLWVKHAEPRAILRWVTAGKSSRVRMSEDKVQIKDSCWFVEMVYYLRELPGVSTPVRKWTGFYNVIAMRREEDQS
jgi:hypothetical protein